MGGAPEASAECVVGAFLFLAALISAAARSDLGPSDERYGKPNPIGWALFIASAVVFARAAWLMAAA